jgi:CDP-diacylglycerol--glycerol-3-phosphate 3-phosphatidyltransferase
MMNENRSIVATPPTKTIDPGAARRFSRGWKLLGATHTAIVTGGFLLLSLAGTPGEAWRWAIKVGLVLSFELLLLLVRRRDVLSGENLERMWGAANLLTLFRGALVALLAGFLFTPRPAGPAAWLPAAIFTVGVAVDFLDGWWARRTASQTRMGSLLDVEFDALGILLAIALAVQYGRLPVPFLAVGAARYVFVAAIALRRRRGKPVAQLPPSYLRRRLAGFQMGVLAVLLWPIAVPPTTTIGEGLIGLPLLAGFVRDWLLVSGRLDPRDERYRRVLSALGRAAYRWLPLALRGALAAVAVLGLTAILSGGSIAAPWLALPRLASPLAPAPLFNGASPGTVLSILAQPGTHSPGLALVLLFALRYLFLGALVAGWKVSPAALALLVLEALRVFGNGLDAPGLVVVVAALLLYVLGPGPLAAATKTAGAKAGSRLGLLLWIPVPFLLYWAVRDIHLVDTLTVLSRLNGLPLAALVGVNLLFLLVVTGRWALILRGLGAPIPLPALVSYRLAGFAVSYLTPGPQFGGEPAQLLLAKRRSALDYGTGSASILLDKSFELLGNLAFLALGAGAILAAGIPGAGASAGLSGQRPWALFLIPGALVLLPLLYLAASSTGRRPLSWLLGRLPQKFMRRGALAPIALSLASTEDQVAAFLRRRARSLALALGFFVLVWGISLLEMWLALRFLGVSVHLREVLVLLAGSRFAFLLPLPGALGALEATQVSLFALLELPADAAWALLVYIRARDLALAAVGLLAVGIGLKRSPRSEALPAEPGQETPPASLETCPEDSQGEELRGSSSAAASGSAVVGSAGQPGGTAAEVLEKSR